MEKRELKPGDIVWHKGDVWTVQAITDTAVVIVRCGEQLTRAITAVMGLEGVFRVALDSIK